MEVRRYITLVEEILEEGGRRMEPAGKRAAAIAVIKNPFAGKYVEDLTPLIEIGDKLGGILGKMAVDALGIKPEAAENYARPPSWARPASASTPPRSCTPSWEPLSAAPWPAQIADSLG